MFLEATLHDWCNKDSYYAFYYWTAGQRMDLSEEDSPFIWRVTSADGHDETVSNMNYTNWMHGQPNNFRGEQGCMHLQSYPYSYTWNDLNCDDAYCAVCELDLGL